MTQLKPLSLTNQAVSLKTLDCEERSSDSPFVKMVWRSESAEATPFISLAQTHWGIVVSNFDGVLTTTIRGPETKPTEAFCPPQAEFWGILFEPGVLMPKFPASRLANRNDISLPNHSGNKFWLNSSGWDFPDFNNAETFVEWLIRDGLLYFDDEVSKTLHNHPSELSTRTLQRRFKRATGMTRGEFDQIHRARHAIYLLLNGISTQEVVYQTGYFDQSHLIRSLKRFIGLTPNQILNEHPEYLLSHLYNTLLPQ